MMIFREVCLQEKDTTKIITKIEEDYPITHIKADDAYGYLKGTFLLTLSYLHFTIIHYSKSNFEDFQDER